MDNATLTVPQALSRAFSAYSAGKLGEAEQLCQQIVDTDGGQFAALHLLAIVQSALGKKAAALASYDRALSSRPDHAEVLCNRGVTLHQLERFEEGWQVTTAPWRRARIMPKRCPIAATRCGA
jgi:Tfp pilus assembly protein PilF